MPEVSLSQEDKMDAMIAKGSRGAEQGRSVDLREREGKECPCRIVHRRMEIKRSLLCSVVLSTQYVFT